MISIPRCLAHVSEGGTHKLANCWKIVRKDGVNLRFTDHNKKLTVATEVYTPVGGINSSAIRKNDTLRGQDLEYIGVINSAAITTENLREGRYRGARVYHYLVDWRWPWMGIISSSLYLITKTNFNGDFWRAELGGLSTLLEQSVGDVFTRNCRVELGDAECTVNLASFRQNNSQVQSVSTQRIIFVGSDGGYNGQPANYYSFGFIKWTSGPNANLYSEVALNTAGSGGLMTFTLFDTTIFDIGNGNTFEITAGCDKLSSTCKTKFNNIVNFRGFPYMPGQDRVFENPTLD